MAEPFVPEVQKALIDLFIVERACGKPVASAELASVLQRRGQPVSDSYVLDRLETLTSKGTLARSTQGYYASDGARVDLERIKPLLGFLNDDLRDQR